MQQTSNYNLNLPEGTDVVNPLVDYNPNFSTIDGAMKANADRTVGRATCIKSGTTHVVTRSNPDSPIINFTATGDWNEGDTMTVDSAPVSVYLPDGSAPLTGAYVINTDVVAVINGSRVTLQLSNPFVAPDAGDISYDNSGSGLSATNVQDAIDELSEDAVSTSGAVNLIQNQTLTVSVDSYVTITNDRNYLGSVDIYTANDVLCARLKPLSSIADNTASAGILVKKGMKVKVGANSFTSCTLTPLDV